MKSAMPCNLSGLAPIEAIDAHNAPSFFAVSRRRTRDKIAVIHSRSLSLGEIFALFDAQIEEQPLRRILQPVPFARKARMKAKI
jgi:hypothetical protein